MQEGGGQDQARDAGLRGSLQGTVVQGYRPAGELLGQDHLVGQGDHPLDGRELCQDPDTANLIVSQDPEDLIYYIDMYCLGKLN